MTLHRLSQLTPPRKDRWPNSHLVLVCKCPPFRSGVAPSIFTTGVTHVRWNPTGVGGQICARSSSPLGLGIRWDGGGISTGGKLWEVIIWGDSLGSLKPMTLITRWWGITYFSIFFTSILREKDPISWAHSSDGLRKPHHDLVVSELKSQEWVCEST